MMMEALLVT